MKDNEKKAKAAEEEKTEKLTDEQLAQVTGGKEDANGSETSEALKADSGITGNK